MSRPLCEDSSIGERMRQIARDEGRKVLDGAPNTGPGYCSKGCGAALHGQHKNGCGYSGLVTNSETVQPPGVAGHHHYGADLDCGLRDTVALAAGGVLTVVEAVDRIYLWIQKELAKSLTDPPRVYSGIYPIKRDEEFESFDYLKAAPMTASELAVFKAELAKLDLGTGKWQVPTIAPPIWIDEWQKTHLSESELATFKAAFAKLPHPWLEPRR